MSAAPDVRTVRSLLLVPAILLALGLIIDFGFTRPRLQEVTRLEAERAHSLGRAESRAATEREGRELARSLGAEDLPSALDRQRGEDPVNFLGARVQQSGLARLQLTSRASSTTNGLRQSDYTLKVEGNFSGITGLVRSLESGPRVVAVNSISILPVNGSAALDAQLDLSVYDLPESRP